MSARTLAPALLFVVTCVGNIGPAGEDGTDDPAEAESPLCEGQLDVGHTTIRRLTRVEYDNTIRDLLGVDGAYAGDFVPEEELHGFDNNAETLTVGELLAEQYLAAAEAISKEVDLTALAACGEGEDERACARRFIERVGRRAYRRPLASEQVETLLAVYDAGTSDTDHTLGLEMVLQAMLQSPSFLYRVELTPATDPEAVVPLDSHEIASRLSYLIWRSMPDEALLLAADAGELEAPEAIVAHAERMLDNPKAAVTAVDFFRQLLDLDALADAPKDPERYPELDGPMRARLADETRAFVAHWFGTGDADVSTLFLADYTFLDDALADYYEIPELVLGDALTHTTLPPNSHRGGILRQGALLAVLGKFAGSDPVRRGLFVRDRLLCQPLPPPPDIEFEETTPDPDETARERLAQHREDPSCASCHDLIDPIGFGFEHYDGAGRHRDEDGGEPVDATGEIVGSDDADGTFDGLTELSERLSGSEQVRACFALHWFRYAFGRDATEHDQCTLEAMEAILVESGSFRELVLSVVASDAFRYGRAKGGGS